jgi:acetyl-CoA synthetase
MSPTSTDPYGIADLLATYDTAQRSTAALLCDDHDPERVAFTVIEEDLSSTDLNYGELTRRSTAFAAALRDRGVEQGTRVAVLMGKSADLVVALLAIWRLGAVHVPLFTAFATPAIELRLTASGAQHVIVDADQRHKLDSLPGLSGMTVLETGPDFDELTQGSADIEPVAVGGDGTLVQLFTSGTTGNPKGVPVPQRALAAFRSYLRDGLDVRDDDVFWNAADPGWAYGLYYGILGPLAAGQRNLLLRGGFSPERTAAIMERFGVTNFASAPTVYRSLSKSGVTFERPLRRASSAGEPLTPDVSVWSAQALGTEVRDQYGQTEQGMFIANCWADGLREPVRPGSMGKPLPGYSADVVDDQVAIDLLASPLSWFTGYVDEPEKTAERFSDDGRWYFTGDQATKDDDGYFFFTARDDDVILMAGYRIGPFEVESVLVKHPRVADVAVVGKPDELRGEALVAYVVLDDGGAGSDELTAELQQLVKSEFAAHAYPRQVHYLPELPKTPSGKMQRYLLRGRVD